MTRPVYEGISITRVDTSAPNSATIDIPTHDSGDLLVLVYFNSRNNQNIATLTTPTGWTAEDTTLPGPSGTDRPGMRNTIFSKFGNGTETTVTVSVSNNQAARHHAYCLRFSGTANTLAAAISATSAVSSTAQVSTFTAPDTTITNGDDSLVIWSGGFQDNTPTEAQFSGNSGFNGTLRGFTSWEASAGSGFAVTNGVSVGDPDSDTATGSCTFANQFDTEWASGITIAIYGTSTGAPLRTDSTLSSLTVGSGAADSFSFDTDTLSYALSVPNSMASIQLTPTATDGATITVNGTAVTSGSLSSAIPLTSNGDTTITVVGTAEDGNSTTTYTFVISRAASSDASLASLAVSTGSLAPSFDADRFHYFLSTSASSVRVTPTTGNSGATMTVAGFSLGSGVQSGAFNVTAGTLFSLDIVVVAEDGVTTGTYQVHILRELTNSNNNYLSNMVWAGLTVRPDFSPLMPTYRISVDAVQATAFVTATAAQGDATLTVNGTAVNSGSVASSGTLTLNAVTAVAIVVTAENGNTHTYTVNITRGTIPSAAGDRSALRRGLSRALKRAV